VQGHPEDWPEAPDLIELDASGQPRPADVANWLGSPRVRLRIPAELAALAHQAQAQQAQGWQQAVRAAFQTAFAQGYVAVGFSRAEPDRPRYLLEARPEP
jgi:predicted GNAT superfamily acetyltransferase